MTAAETEAEDDGSRQVVGAYLVDAAPRGYLDAVRPDRERDRGVDLVERQDDVVGRADERVVGVLEPQEAQAPVGLDCPEGLGVARRSWRVIWLPRSLRISSASANECRR